MIYATASPGRGRLIRCSLGARSGRNSGATGRSGLRNAAKLVSRPATRTTRNSPEAGCWSGRRRRQPARTRRRAPRTCSRRDASVRVPVRRLLLRTTISSAGPRSAGYCSVCDCERVRVPASTALAVAARPPRGRQGERPAFAAAGVSADERARDLLSAESRTAAPAFYARVVADGVADFVAAWDDTRASGPAPARRLFATTCRRVGRDFASSRVCGRRARRSSRGPRGDAGNNPCSRQGDRVVALTTACRALAEDDRRRRIRSAAPGADVEPEHVVAGRRRPLCSPPA